MEILKIKLVKCMKMTPAPQNQCMEYPKNVVKNMCKSLCSKKYSMDNFKII